MDPGGTAGDPGDGPVPRSANPAPERREGAAPAEAGLVIEAMHFDSATLEGPVRDFFARLSKVGAILGESPTSVSLYYWLLSAAAAGAAAGAAWTLVRRRRVAGGDAFAAEDFGDPVFSWAPEGDGDSEEKRW